MQLGACRYCSNYAPAAPAAAVEVRQCIRCGARKPLSDFGRKGGRGGPRPGEYQLTCKACVRQERAAAKRRAHVAAVVAAPDAPVVPHKVCTRCDKSLPVTAFAPYDGTFDKLDFLCHDCRARATAERERRLKMVRRGRKPAAVPVATGEGA